MHPHNACDQCYKECLVLIKIRITITPDYVGASPFLAKEWVCYDCLTQLSKPHGQ